MKFHWPAALCAALLGGIAMPVSADISAIYEVQSDDEFEQALDFAMTIEVNDAGDARLHITGRTGYFLIRDGEAYKVSRGIDGPYAEKLDDLEAVIVHAGHAGGISLELLENFPRIELVDKGTVEVGQWQGRGYGQAEGEMGSGWPQLVISQEESLRPIGGAFSRLSSGRFGAMRMLTLSNLFGGFGFYDPEVREVIAGGTPIRINMLELSAVSTDAVDPARFELPDRVLTREEISARDKPFEWAPAFDRQPTG